MTDCRLHRIILILKKMYFIIFEHMPTLSTKLVSSLKSFSPLFFSCFWLTSLNKRRDGLGVGRHFLSQTEISELKFQRKVCGVFSMTIKCKNYYEEKWFDSLNEVRKLIQMVQYLGHVMDIYVQHFVMI